MLFNSLQFLIFFPVVTTLYFLISHRYRWVLLLTASAVFYMAFIPIYILVLIITIIIDYCAGIWIEQSTGRKRKFFLVTSIVSTSLVLFIFKYFNFFNANLSALAQFLHWNYPISALDIILPIGLSFHTFQSLSYVIEVYRGRQKAEYNFGIYSLYVMFYPQLVAGPIERPQNLLHQFYEYHPFDYRRISDGLKLMLWGFFKKIMIADRLAPFVNQAYNDPTSFQGVSLILATVFFAYQIYCDFSGYSDIAIGAARVMGFNLMKNFNQPYVSKSISEFWKRWHISLSTWFRDYLYLPLGGNRVLKLQWYANLMITFVVSGFWHGANWTFILWGLFHGFYLVFGIITKPAREYLVKISGLSRLPRIYNFIQTITTFILVSLAWVFFRANNVETAWYIIINMLNGAGDYLHKIVNNLGQSHSGLLAPFLMGNTREELFIALISIVVLELIQFAQRTAGIQLFFDRQPRYVRWAAYYVIVFSILILGVYKKTPFIYYQF